MESEAGSEAGSESGVGDSNAFKSTEQGMQPHLMPQASDHFHPSPRNFLDMSDDDDEGMPDELDKNGSSLTNHSGDLAPATRPIDSFLLPADTQLPPLTRHVRLQRQASDPLCYLVYALENHMARRTKITPPSFIDPRESEFEMMVRERWRSRMHRVKLPDRHRPLYKTLLGRRVPEKTAWGKRRISVTMETDCGEEMS